MSLTKTENENIREMVRLLRSHGITPTRQRLTIAQALLAHPQHLSAEQVLELTNRTGREVSKATVYNTLGLFVRKGLIRELNVDSNRVYYDSKTHRHHHFYNPLTGELTDIGDGQLQIEPPAELPPGMEIDRIDVVVHLRTRQDD